MTCEDFEAICSRPIGSHTASEMIAVLRHVDKCERCAAECDAAGERIGPVGRALSQSIVEEMQPRVVRHVQNDPEA